MKGNAQDVVHVFDVRMNRDRRFLRRLRHDAARHVEIVAGDRGQHVGQRGVEAHEAVRIRDDVEFAIGEPRTSTDCTFGICLIRAARPGC